MSAAIAIPAHASPMSRLRARGRAWRHAARQHDESRLKRRESTKNSRMSRRLLTWTGRAAIYHRFERRQRQASYVHSGLRNLACEVGADRHESAESDARGGGLVKRAQPLIINARK